MLSKYFLLFFLMSLTSCVTSTNKIESSEDSPDKVISRIDNLGERPDWINESEPFKINAGKVQSLGQTTIPGDNRVEAAYRIAENNAKQSLCSAIEQRLDFVFQNAEEGTSIDSVQSRYIGGEVCKMTTSSIRPGKRFWEKFATTTDSGDRVTRYRVFATIEMPEREFKKAVLDAINRQAGKGGLTTEFARKVDIHWDKLVEGESFQTEGK